MNQCKPDTLDEICAKHVLHTWAYLGYNKTRTAKALGIGLRTLQRNLKRWENEGKLVTVLSETKKD